VIPCGHWWLYDEAVVIKFHYQSVIVGELNSIRAKIFWSINHKIMKMRIGT
jgi:hypothetical protein